MYLYGGQRTARSCARGLTPPPWVGERPGFSSSGTAHAADGASRGSWSNAGCTGGGGRLRDHAAVLPPGARGDGGAASADVNPDNGRLDGRGRPDRASGGDEHG